MLKDLSLSLSLFNLYFSNRYASGKDLNINPFTMVLNGVIDAAVSGGVSMYQKAFLTPEFASANPDCADLINMLKLGILYQVHILEKGKRTHSSTDWFFPPSKKQSVWILSNHSPF